MRALWIPVVLVALAGRAREAAAYACNNRYYVNSSGHVVPFPPSCDQENSFHHTAECRDGSTSFSEHHRGTCSHHGEVAHWE